jgi:hypothetical protein
MVFISQASYLIDQIIKRGRCALCILSVICNFFFFFSILASVYDFAVSSSIAETREANMGSICSAFLSWNCMVICTTSHFKWCVQQQTCKD